MTSSFEEYEINEMRVFVVDALVGNDYSLCLGRGLKKNGVEVELVTVEERTAPFEVAFPLRKWAPSKTSRESKGRKLRGYVAYLVRLFNYLQKARREGEAVVHFQFFRRERIETFYLWLLRVAGVKLVYTAHNIVPHESTKIDRFLKYIVYRSSHAIIVHSEHVKRALLATFTIDAEKIHVVPHGNFDHYLPESPLSEKEARSVLGLGEDDVVLLFFGYIRAYKGLDMLLEAFDIAASANPRLHLVIAGMPHTADMERTTRAFIERSAAKDRILFHAQFIAHDAIKHYFTGADLVILPYKHIYHSGIVHLAYSYGKAVVATNVGDFSETIEPGKSGVILAENTAECLAEQLIEMAGQKQRLERMGACAKALSTTKYSWDDIGRKTIAVYRSVTGGAG